MPFKASVRYRKVYSVDTQPHARHTGHHIVSCLCVHCIPFLQQQRGDCLVGPSSLCQTLARPCRQTTILCVDSGPIYAPGAETDVVWVVLFSEMVVSFQVKRCTREWYLSLLRLARAAAIWSSDSSSMCTVLTCFMMSAQ